MRSDTGRIGGFFRTTSMNPVGLPTSDRHTDHLLVATLTEATGNVEHVRDPPAHPRREIASGLAKHDDAAAGHVLAAVIADAFHDGDRAAVPDSEALARHAADERVAARRAVK